MLSESTGPGHANAEESVVCSLDGRHDASSSTALSCSGELRSPFGQHTDESNS